MQGTKKKPRTGLSEIIRTAMPAVAIIAAGVWTQFSRLPDAQPVSDLAVSDTFETLAPAVAVEPGDPPDNDAAPVVPDLSPASPETTPDADNA